MTNKNYFLDPDRAALYHSSRPSFHSQTLEAFHKNRPHILYEHALDVGCGTGQSTEALAHWSKRVTGIDNSQSMLKHAVKSDKIHYQLTDAENLPFERDTFDLVFVASSLHWFEKRKFLNQVSKVLKSGGKYLIYDAYVTEGLSSDFTKAYSSRFPRPFQDVQYKEAELEFFDLKFITLHKYDFVSRLTQDDIARYFFNLSNVSAAIEKGESAEKAFEDVWSLIQSYATGKPFTFQTVLTEISKL